LAGLAVVAFIVGIVIGAGYVSPERKAADRFVRAWQKDDYRTMYDQLSDASRRRVSLESFQGAYRDAAATATTRSLRFGSAAGGGDSASVPVTVRTAVFGTLKTKLTLPFDNGRVKWTPALTFPGVAQGETLTRETELPERAAILAGDGQALAQGPNRVSASGASTDLVGSLGPVSPANQAYYRALGYPDGAQVGASGLEQGLQGQLAGTPGGRLLAGTRLLASSRPRRAKDLRTTIDLKIEDAATTALGGRLGAVAVLRPQTGQVLALSGIALDGLQPPGSTFKIITTTAALEDKKVKLTDQFPVQTAALLSGVPLSNASGESCGGSFVHSFAESCNSVFAPLGAKVGPKRLVQTAEKYGWNEQPSIPGAAESTIPPGDRIGDDLAVGSTAIGQGMVLATALQMASVGATIANGGVRAHPTLLRGQFPRVTRVTSRRVARTMRNLMIEVVRSGTGVKAALPGVTVAGKTGTAELGGPPGANEDPNNSDAWFTSFAPAANPRVAVGVLVVKAGAGGDFAAPVAAQVLQTALQRIK
jgi:cell division protein FtsI/penicillin-binding protein 2